MTKNDRRKAWKSRAVRLLLKTQAPDGSFRTGLVARHPEVNKDRRTVQRLLAEFRNGLIDVPRCRSYSNR